jgi:hypothetical protein
MRLRGGVLSSGLRWSKEQDEISRNTNRQARLLSIMYYAVTVSSVAGLIVISLRTSYSHLYGAANNTETMVNVSLKLVCALHKPQVWRQLYNWELEKLQKRNRKCSNLYQSFRLKIYSFLYNNSTKKLHTRILKFVSCCAFINVSNLCISHP